MDILNIKFSEFYNNLYNNPEISIFTNFNIELKNIINNLINLHTPLIKSLPIIKDLEIKLENINQLDNIKRSEDNIKDLEIKLEKIKFKNTNISIFEICD